MFQRLWNSEDKGSKALDCLRTTGNQVDKGQAIHLEWSRELVTMRTDYASRLSKQ